MQSQERYVLTIESKPKWTTPVAIRLKGVAKQLLRVWGFRLVKLEPHTTPTNTDDKGKTT